MIKLNKFFSVIFDPNNLKSQQKRTVSRDKPKNSYINKYDNGSWILMRFWESDINKDVTKCVDRIEEVLNKKNNFPILINT